MTLMYVMFSGVCFFTCPCGVLGQSGTRLYRFLIFAFFLNLSSDTYKYALAAERLSLILKILGYLTEYIL